jgi:hypothetical protein
LQISYYYDRDYARAVAAARDVMARYPRYPYVHRWLAAALGQSGSADEAHEALDKAIEGSRDAFMAFVHSRPSWIRPANYDQMIEGLRKAGWEG